MRAGELRERIQLQAKAVSRNATGEEVRVWNPLATVWARVTVVSGDETVTLSQEAATLTHQVVIRPYDGVAPMMRVLWRGRVLEIHAVMPDEKHQLMTLLCSEVV